MYFFILFSHHSQILYTDFNLDVSVIIIFLTLAVSDSLSMFKSQSVDLPVSLVSIFLTSFQKWKKILPEQEDGRRTEFRY